jgi:hypothetical protein
VIGNRSGFGALDQARAVFLCGLSNSHGAHGDVVKSKAERALVMAAIFPAIMASILLPLLETRHLPDGVLGAAVGCLLGLSLVGLIALARRSNRSA